MTSSISLCYVLGPTASGKSALAEALARHFDAELISMDSALVYRDMNIGTAKPDSDTLRRYRYRLVDICEPEQTYNAAQFAEDAAAAVRDIAGRGKLPIIVGGTMLYYKALTEGLSQLPGTNLTVRAALREQFADNGPLMHAELSRVDPASAARIHPNDPQRLLRALEVIAVSDEPMSVQWARRTPPLSAGWRSHALALSPPRPTLHAKIAQRLLHMWDAGLLDEVRGLMQRPQLSAAHSAMRAVGYRQVWAHLLGDTSFAECQAQTLAATRQLAKRQCTWLRSTADLHHVSDGEASLTQVIDAVEAFLTPAQ